MPSQGSTNQRGYGWKHQRERAKWVPRVRAGGVSCWRCGLAIPPSGRWDLGHLPGHEPRTGNPRWHPEHVGRECPAGGNRATSSRRRKASRPTPAWFETSTDEPDALPPALGG